VVVGLIVEMVVTETIDELEKNSPKTKLPLVMVSGIVEQATCVV
jgi:hypothetical protein